MNWLSNNWIWLMLGIGALALLRFGGAGCGMGHGGHDHRRRSEEGRTDISREALSTPAARVGSADATLQPADHTHGGPPAKEAALVGERAAQGRDAGQREPRRHRHGC